MPASAAPCIPTMSLVARLISLVAEAIERPEPERDDLPDHSLAIAALLVHVARVDGRIEDSERERVDGLLRARLNLSADAARRLAMRADALDRETDDIADLIEMMGHGVTVAKRHDLVAMAYAVAAADGRIDEFEDDLVWRTGHLLGLSDDEIAAAKAGVPRPAPRPAPPLRSEIPEPS